MDILNSGLSLAFRVATVHSPSQRRGDLGSTYLVRLFAAFSQKGYFKISLFILDQVIKLNVVLCTAR